METSPLRYVEAGPGILQLEDDIKAPLPSPEQLAALSLGAKGNAEARACNAELLAGHLATVVCSLFEIIKNDPHTKHMVIEDMIVIPKSVSDRVTGMQVEAIMTGDGDVGIKRRERMSQLIVVGN